MTDSDDRSITGMAFVEASADASAVINSDNCVAVHGARADVGSLAQVRSIARRGRADAVALRAILGPALGRARSLRRAATTFDAMTRRFA